MLTRLQVESEMDRLEQHQRIRPSRLMHRKLCEALLEMMDREESEAQREHRMKPGRHLSKSGDRYNWSWRNNGGGEA